MRQVLLLTATVAPKQDTKDLTHIDPEARLRDYETALALYLGELARGTFDHIVFAENSGYPLTVLESMVRDRGLERQVSFISFVSSLGPQNTRFFLELDLLIEAMRRPPLSVLEPDARMWKVTGRYIVRNIRDLVRTAPGDADVYVNSRTRPIRWTEFYIAAFNREAFHRVLADALESFRETASGEEVMWRRVNEEAPAGLRIVQRFRRVPKLQGVRGWDGRRYDDARGRVGRAVRVVANRLVPWLWI